MSGGSVKTALEIERLRIAAEALERVLADLATVVKPGVSTRDLDHVAGLALRRHGLQSVLDGYRGYPSVSCTSVNNVAAHGVPGERVLAEGDLVTVDVSADRDGFKADAAWTYAVGRQKPANRRLLRAAWRCMSAGTQAARAGARTGDVGAAIAKEAQALGCRVIGRFTGHGIGRELHEDPVMPHLGEPGRGVILTPGMVFNIEPVVTLGSGEAHKLQDGWSYVTSDGSVCAQYEVTVVVTEQGPRVLTLGRLGGETPPAEPPYGASGTP